MIKVLIAAVKGREGVSKISYMSILVRFLLKVKQKHLKGKFRP